MTQRVKLDILSPFPSLATNFLDVRKHMRLNMRLNLQNWFLYFGSILKSVKCKNFSDSKQFFVQIYRHANRILAIIIMGKSLRKLRRCSGLVIFGIVKTSTFIWWYPGVDMYCNIKISFMLHRLFRGYNLTIGYTARYTLEWCL